MDILLAILSSRRVSNLNMFSSALPLEKMKRITKAGTSECGAPGDLLSWEQTNLTFIGTSTHLRVDPREGPCFARRSPLLVSSGEFSQPECMKHCRKLGTISPPVQTLSQWQNLKKELSAFQEQAVLTRFPDPLAFGSGSGLQCVYTVVISL